MYNYERFINSTKSTLKTLPIVHTCSAYSFRSILQTKVLRTHECDVFEGENYLYTYYGIPSYRQMNKEATGHPSFFPVCFVFDYKEISQIAKLHLFDTGAFMKLDEFKKKYFYPEMELKQFELKPSISQATKVVQKYFNTNINYIQRNSQYRKSDVGPLDFEEFSYVSIIEDETSGELDSRVATIELIHDENIELNRQSLMHIILPKRFLDDAVIEEIITEELQVRSPDTYLLAKGNPNEYFGVIYNEYMKYIESNNLA